MTVQLVYDGACPFCRHFALRSELTGGVPGLQLSDGRRDPVLRRELKRRGFDLARGAVVIDGQQAWHGAEAIAELCRRMEPSDALLQLLQRLFSESDRARRLYPLLLLARRLALWFMRIPDDPDRTPLGTGSQALG